MLRIWWASVEIYIFCSYPRQALYVILLLIKTDTYYLEWSVSFFTLPLLSMYGDQFQISPEELARLQSNKKGKYSSNFCSTQFYTIPPAHT